jgi:hypothetical protein
LTPPEQLVLHSPIEKLKKRTEDYLGKANANVTLTFPSFLNSTQKLLLHNALEEASIQSFPCPHAENSTKAATLAARHARHHYNKPNCTSSIECIIGPFSAEVIMVGYTGSMLAFSLFNIYVGKQIQFQEYEKHCIVLKNSPTKSEDIDTIFWKNSNPTSDISYSTESSYLEAVRFVLTGL